MTATATAERIRELLCYDRSRGRWAAYIKVGDLRKNLGRFLSENEAHAAYLAASRQLHGEFAQVL